jgi:hypothetical protein
MRIHASKFRLGLKVEKGCSYHLVTVSAPQYCQSSHYRINPITLLTHRVYETICIAADKDTITKDRNGINFEVETLLDACEDGAATEEQLNLITGRKDEMRIDREALIYEAICIAADIEAVMENRDAVDLEVEIHGDASEEATALTGEPDGMRIDTVSYL